MKDAIALQDYLRHWREHLSDDVQGQSSITEHLDDTRLTEFTRISKELLKSNCEDLLHLSTCPECMERWAEICKAVISGNEYDNDALASISFGEMNDDVQGQSGELVSKSACQRFTLYQNETSDALLIKLSSTDEALEGKLIHLNDRLGVQILSGKILKGEISGSIQGSDDVDLSIWTVSVKRQ